MKKAFEEKQPMAVIWIIDGKEAPPSAIPNQFVYLDAANKTVAHWDGVMLPVTNENGVFTFRQKAYKGKAVSLASFIAQSQGRPDES